MRAIMYQDDREFVQACHSREETIATIGNDTNLKRLIGIHKKMVNHGKCIPCEERDSRFVTGILEFVITDVVHGIAQTDYLFNREIKEDVDGK